jgi:hypothetical protein
MTPIPAACSSLMTPVHIEPSANAPCTRSTVGVLPFRGDAEWIIAELAAVGRAWLEAKAAARALAWVTLLLLGATAGTLPYMLRVAPIRALVSLCPCGKRAVNLVRRWDEQASGGLCAPAFTDPRPRS